MESVCASHNACALSHAHALTTAPAERCILCVLQETVIFSDDNDNVPQQRLTQYMHSSHMHDACAFNALAERCVVSWCDGATGAQLHGELSRVEGKGLRPSQGRLPVDALVDRVHPGGAHMRMPI